MWDPLDQPLSDNRTLEPSHGVVEVLGGPPVPRAPLENRVENARL